MDSPIVEGVMASLKARNAETLNKLKSSSAVAGKGAGPPKAAKDKSDAFKQNTEKSRTKCKESEEADKDKEKKVQASYMKK